MDIINYEKLYSIDESGRVYSIRYKRYLSPSRDSCGYLFVGLSNGGNVKQKLIHRLVAEAFIPNPFNKPQVNHMDGNKVNNQISNLEWCTQSENILHGFRHGLYKSNTPVGSKHKKAKLNESQVLEIRKKYLLGNKLTWLAREYGVSDALISNIVKRKCWKHV